MTEDRLSRGLQKCMGDLWEGDDFSDFSVVVEGTTYRCHRFILAACSGFFQGLFRSNMKECQENSVKIEGIDQETFRVVLHSVYRGAGGITLDNFLDVWRASEQLQIGFLIDECQWFAQQNIWLDNCFKVLDFAHSFVCGHDVRYILKYITENFEDVYNTVDMMKLSFDDFYTIISSDFLCASKEDLVLETVINWCGYDEPASETLHWNTEFGAVDKMAQNDMMNQSAGIKSGDCNKNDTTTTFFSTAALDCQKNDISFPAQLYPDVESKGRQDELTLDASLVASILDCVEDSSIQSAEESQVAASKKRPLSSSGSDDDSENNDGPKSKVRRSDRNKYLIELIAACRLCLVSSKYLQELLETNSRVRLCQETTQMLLQALVYSLDMGQRHDCWPDQAIRRMGGNRSHVMVYWCDNGIEAYDIRTGNSKRILNSCQAGHCSCNNIEFVDLAVFDDSLYGVLGTISGTSRALSAGIFTTFQGFTPMSLRLQQNAKMIAHDKSLYVLTKWDFEESVLWRCKMGLGAGSDWERSEYFHLEANCLVRFNQYILVFYTTNDIVISKCYDTISETNEELTSTMDGTSEDMTSFIYRGDVFLVQTNGSLWKITEAGEDHEIQFELVTRLWDNNINILGLVMFQSKLHLFVNEDSVKNVTFSEDLPTSLPQMVRIPLAITTKMVPMLVPSTLL